VNNKKRVNLVETKLRIMKNGKWFIAEIEILQNEWGYEIGQIIQIPVMASSGASAFARIDKCYQGSEFPNYKICRINLCDDFIFNPSRLK
jgi:hypothetical protein